LNCVISLQKYGNGRVAISCTCLKAMAKSTLPAGNRTLIQPTQDLRPYYSYLQFNIIAKPKH